MVIEILATRDSGLTAQEALNTAKEKNKEVLSNLEHDELLNGVAQEWTKYKPAYFAWTRTHIKYGKGALKAEVWNEGEKKHTQIDLPLRDGWYKTEKKYGIPNGSPSDSSDSEARYLWRYQDEAYEGLVSRGGFFVDDLRVVYCGLRPSARFGVLCVSKGKRPVVKPDEALIWLKKTAKTNKNARKILKRLREGEA